MSLASYVMVEGALMSRVMYLANRKPGDLTNDSSVSHMAHRLKSLQEFQVYCRAGFWGHLRKNIQDVNNLPGPIP